MRNDRRFQLFYKIAVHNVVTDWQKLTLDEPYGDNTEIMQANDIWCAINWRIKDIGKAISELESTVAKVVEFKVVEVDKNKVPITSSLDS